MLRVVVVQNCNYEWSFADEETRNDSLIDDVLVVSRDYELYLMGLELDYKNDDFEQMFKFNNLHSCLHFKYKSYHSYLKNTF